MDSVGCMLVCWLRVSQRWPNEMYFFFIWLMYLCSNRHELMLSLKTNIILIFIKDWIIVKLIFLALRNGFKIEIMFRSLPSSRYPLPTRVGIRCSSRQSREPHYRYHQGRWRKYSWGVHQGLCVELSRLERGEHVNVFKVFLLFEAANGLIWRSFACFSTMFSAHSSVLHNFVATNRVYNREYSLWVLWSKLKIVSKCMRLRPTQNRSIDDSFR